MARVTRVWMTFDHAPMVRATAGVGQRCTRRSLKALVWISMILLSLGFRVPAVHAQEPEGVGLDLDDIVEEREEGGQGKGAREEQDEPQLHHHLQEVIEHPIHLASDDLARIRRLEVLPLRRVEVPDRFAAPPPGRLALLAQLAAVLVLIHVEGRQGQPVLHQVANHLRDDEALAEVGAQVAEVAPPECEVEGGDVHVDRVEAEHLHNERVLPGLRVHVALVVVHPQRYLCGALVDHLHHHRVHRRVDVLGHLLRHGPLSRPLRALHDLVLHEAKGAHDGEGDEYSGGEGEAVVAQHPQPLPPLAPLEVCDVLRGGGGAVVDAPRAQEPRVGPLPEGKEERCPHDDEAREEQRVRVPQRPRGVGEVLVRLEPALVRPRHHPRRRRGEQPPRVEDEPPEVERDPRVEVVVDGAGDLLHGHPPHREGGVLELLLRLLPSFLRVQGEPALHLPRRLERRQHARVLALRAAHRRRRRHRAPPPDRGGELHRLWRVRAPDLPEDHEHHAVLLRLRQEPCVLVPGKRLTVLVPERVKEAAHRLLGEGESLGPAEQRLLPRFDLDEELVAMLPRGGHGNEPEGLNLRAQVRHHRRGCAPRCGISPCPRLEPGRRLAADDGGYGIVPRFVSLSGGHAQVSKEAAPALKRRGEGVAVAPGGGALTLPHRTTLVPPQGGRLLLPTHRA
mmetsp:Transcript_32889/g.104700  ORF Transcript_32889/g.104700 Transcript_32889/m.104700 type:complete len:678 (-) Transcript_32889:36-2069(-)